MNPQRNLNRRVGKCNEVSEVACFIILDSTHWKQIKKKPNVDIKM
jgi:hypothetical protein